MIPVPHACENQIKAKLRWHLALTRLPIALFLIFSTVWTVSAQTITWTDSFQKGVTPTSDQCQKWTAFLNQLDGKSFASVTISGTFDLTGKTLSDPVAATRLAQLLATRTEGTVESGGHRFTVSKCQLSNCPDANESFSVALSYDGNTSECDCGDRYAIRPQSRNRDWGGVNVSSSCNAASQTMSLVFSSGVSIEVNGSATLCEGSSVELTANADICSEPLLYAWSNGATTRSITVSEPGNYSVTVSDASGCSGISETVVVTRTDVAVDAGEDATYCSEPVQLSATGQSSGGSGTMVNKVCMFNAPGGSADCTFTTDVCLEGAVLIPSTTYVANVTYSNPVELRYHMYYSAFANISTFRFKLNNQELGTYSEIDPTGACDTEVEGKFPRSFAFPDSEFKQYWIEGGSNELRVEIETQASGGIYLAGITAEVVTSNEFYSWSPLAGLSNASIRNPLASPAENTVYTVTYTDVNGCTATGEVEVVVDCTEEGPVAVCKEIIVELEEGCTVDIPATAFDGGSTTNSGAPLTFSASPAGPYAVGVTEIELTVTDVNGGTSTCQAKITVTDPILPSFAVLEDIVIENDEGGCAATMLLQTPDVTDNCAIESVTHDQADNIFAVGETIVTWTAKDIYGNTQTATQRIIVTNASPVINSVRAFPSTVKINAPVRLTTNFSDNNAKSAVIDWGDTSIPDVVNNPAETFETSHSYREAGSYNITITVTDNCEGTTVANETVVVFDQGASVRGDGWFNSERGFYLKDPRASGKAQFHFEAKHHHSSSVPVGSASFKFKEGSLDFRSTGLEWFTVADDMAILMAKGKLNGKRDHTILIAAVDEDPQGHDHPKKPKKGEKKGDQIRVKIWDAAGQVIYDTQAGDPDNAVATTDIGGGSIDIKQSKFTDFAEYVQEAISSYFGDEATSVYPNPFTEWLNVQYNSDGKEDIVIQLVDLAGKVVASQAFPVSDDGHYTIDVPENAKEGIYILIIKQGKRIEYLRLVRK